MKRGFTLIELLIVIAIIAILALIAIPNFLESQVRARVSRVYADMRSMATALEAYTADYNLPPPGQRAYNALSGNPSEWAVNALTTPIAYVTSLPQDPFVVMGKVLEGDPGKGENAPVSKASFYEYQTLVPYSGVIFSDREKKCWKNGIYWVIVSAGPSRRMGQPHLIGQLSGDPIVMQCPYDPTNGTVSSGMIWRTNKGMGLAGAVKR